MSLVRCNYTKHEFRWIVMTYFCNREFIMLLNIRKFILHVPDAQMLKAWERELYLCSNDNDYRNRMEAKEPFSYTYSAFTLSGWSSKCYVPFKDIASAGFGILYHKRRGQYNSRKSFFHRFESKAMIC